MSCRIFTLIQHPPYPRTITAASYKNARTHVLTHTHLQSSIHIQRTTPICPKTFLGQISSKGHRSTTATPNFPPRLHLHRLIFTYSISATRLADCNPQACTQHRSRLFATPSGSPMCYTVYTWFLTGTTTYLQIEVCG